MGPPRYAPPPAHKAAPAAPDPWAGIPSAEETQADTLVSQFLASVGWPKGYDANQAALHLVKSGINVGGDPFAAYEWLYNNTISGATKDNQPWGRFGMLKADYDRLTNGLNAVMFDWTGGQLDAETLKQAIRQNWTPDEVRNFAQYGNAQGGTAMLASAQLSGDMPWLSQGQTYSQTLAGFQAFEMHAPTDRATLAAWFRFGAGAKQLGNAPEAVVQARPVQAGAASVVR